MEKMHAKACGAKFVDIDQAIYDKRTTKTIKLLGLD